MKIFHHKGMNIIVHEDLKIPDLETFMEVHNITDPDEVTVIDADSKTEVVKYENGGFVIYNRSAETQKEETKKQNFLTKLGIDENDLVYLKELLK